MKSRHVVNIGYNCRNDKKLVRLVLCQHINLYANEQHNSTSIINHVVMNTITMHSYMHAID